MAIARMACSRTLDLPGLGGVEQWSSRGGGRGTEFAQGQGGVDLNPVAVVFEQPAAQAVDHRRRGAGQPGQHLGHLDLDLVVRVIEEEHQAAQGRFAGLAPPADGLHRGGPYQGVGVL